MGEIRKTEIKRNIGADVIRCLAFFSVVSVHFLLNNGFYKNTVEGEKMFIMIFMRSFFIICVPLFMMLSGYLMRNKKPTGDYYRKLGKTYLTYVLACLCCIIYSALYTDKVWSLKQIVFSIFDFSAARYSWYVEMYLGLFLIIPFLNLLYNNVLTKNLKKVLILVLVIMTSLPAVVNVYNFETAGWWLLPSSSRDYTQILPEWWTALYPVTYYMIGCYLSEYGIKLKKWLNAVLIIAVWGMSALYTYWRSYKSTFIWGNWCDYESVFNVALTTLVFVFLININYEKTPKFVASLFKTVSALSFASYLVSSIFDGIFYPVLIEKIPEMTDRLGYYFVTVPLVFVCSLVLSFIISKVQYLLELLFAFVNKLCRKK